MARTDALAMTPVPGAAGIRMTFVEVALPVTSCGIVVPTIGMRTRRLRASFTDFSTAFGTCLALPKP